MILAFDTYYYEDKARTVALQFENWQDLEESRVFDETLSGISEYVSGEFYKRELPCILSLLKQIDLTHCETIIIDGFVILDDEGKLGLGGYLYEALSSKIPVIGVAKNNFSQINRHKKAILRGESKKPLYITVMGMDLELAADKIKDMNGDYRFPNILKRVDAIGRDNIV